MSSLFTPATEWAVVLLLVVTLFPLNDVTYIGEASFKKLRSCDVDPFCWFNWKGNDMKLVFRQFTNRSSQFA